MKIAVYSPYLDTAGGGEKYMLTIAQTLSRQHRVEILLDPHLCSLGIEHVMQRIEKLHDLNLNRVKYIPAPIGPGTSFIKRALFLKNYDWFFCNTDGSLFYSTAKNNIVHFQVPFENINCRGLWGKIKLSTWKMAIYNSRFTKDIIERNWPISGEVIYPPVAVEFFRPLPKKKQIISVGRFSAATKDKKQEILIESFKKLSKDRLKGWSLHLAGGCAKGDQPYLVELRQLALGADIFFYPDASLDQLKTLYGESMIFWHAKGFAEEDPKKTEHFGITTVEAMASGCVPVVINKGGQPEIVIDRQTGLLWSSLEELEDQTLKLINDSKLREEMSRKAIERSRMFSQHNFEDRIQNLIKE